MADGLAIGVDVGGTKIASVLTNRAGDVLAEDLRPTQPDTGVSAVLDQIAASIEVVVAQADGAVLGIGIGCPGPVDPDTGLSLYAVNMGANWREINLRAETARRISFDVPVFAENDVNAGGLGEAVFGIGRQYSDFVFSTVGTGLGGCAVVGGRVLRGTRFAAMEIGHIVYEPEGRVGDFGLRGTTEMYISGKGFSAGYHQHAPHYPNSSLMQHASVSVQHILEAARTEDDLALRILDEGVAAYATALSWCITILDPQAIIIGGGLGLAMRDLLDGRLRHQLQQRIIPETFAALTINYAQVTNSALGPAALVFHNHEES